MLLEILEENPRATAKELKIWFDDIIEPDISELALCISAITPKIENNVTWLIKHYLELGGGFTDAYWDAILGELSCISSWQARLHLCQCFSLALPEEEYGFPQIVLFLEESVVSSKPFVRAWAISAFCHLATVNIAYLAQAKKMLHLGEQDEAKSVKARVRQLQKLSAFV